MFGAGIILAIMFFIVIVACIIMIIEDKATAGKVGVLILCVLLFIGSLIMIFVQIFKMKIKMIKREALNYQRMKKNQKTKKKILNI